MGEALRAGEAQVFDGEGFVPISLWSPPGLRKNFKATYLRPFKVLFMPQSGIGRLSGSKDQYSFLHDRCVILPITKYERINLTAGSRLKLVTKSGRTEYVAFRTTAPSIEVKLLWDT